MLSWQNILVKPTDSIYYAVKIIEKEASRAVLVIDDRRKLLGVVTDGDIRRALIDRLPLESAVQAIMSTQPIVASHQQSKTEIKQMMESLDLLHIPLVDDEGIVVGLETLQTLRHSERHDHCVFLMAGGLGQRLRPFTDEMPKPMLKIGNSPILETILESFIQSGFHQFYISVHYKSEMITEYFGNGSRWGVDIHYVYEEVPLGTAGALGLLPDVCLKKPILVMNGDLLTKINFSRLLDYHLQHPDAAATLCVREYDFQVPYGVIHADQGQILKIHEKPVHKFFVNAGVYIIEPRLIRLLQTSKRMDMTELLNQAMNENEKLTLFPIHEYWLDIGRIDDYKRAQEDYSAGIF